MYPLDVTMPQAGQAASFSCALGLPPPSRLPPAPLGRSCLFLPWPAPGHHNFTLVVHAFVPIHRPGSSTLFGLAVRFPHGEVHLQAVKPT